MTTNNKSLALIVAEMNELVTQIVENGGELTEVLETAFDDVGTQLQAKTDSYAFIMDKLDAEADFWDARAKASAKVAKSCKALRERLNDNIKFAMQQMQADEILGGEMRFKLSKLPPKVVMNPELIPDAYKMVVTETVPDKERIKATLLAGQSVPGAGLEDVYSLRKYANRKG